MTQSPKALVHSGFASIPSEGEVAVPAYFQQFAPDATGSYGLVESVIRGVSAGSREKFSAQLLIAVLADLGSRPGFALEPIDAVECFGRLDAIRSQASA